MAQPGADVKNSDTLWRYRKNFKFLKEVKILSEFLHSKLACLMPICVSGGRPQKLHQRVVKIVYSLPAILSIVVISAPG